MIQQYHLLFDKLITYQDILSDAKDEHGNFLRSKLGADTGIGIIGLDQANKILDLNAEEQKEEEEEEGEDIFAQMNDADEKYVEEEKK